MKEVHDFGCLQIIEILFEPFDEGFILKSKDDADFCVVLGNFSFLLYISETGFVLFRKSILRLMSILFKNSRMCGNTDKLFFSGMIFNRNIELDRWGYPETGSFVEF